MRTVSRETVGRSVVKESAEVDVYDQSVQELSRWGEAVLKGLLEGAQNRRRDGRSGPLGVLLGQRDAEALQRALELRVTFAERGVGEVQEELIESEQHKPDWFPPTAELVAVIQGDDPIWVYVDERPNRETIN